MIEHEDLNLLDEYNAQLRTVVEELNDIIGLMAKLQIVLIAQMGGIEDRLSFDNKLIKLFDKDREHVQNYILMKAEKEQKENLKGQVEEAIKSLKKKLDIVRFYT